jgi:WXG100 family type VII secretion target
MAGFGDTFFMNFSQVAEAATKFGQQATATQQAQSIVKAYGPKIQSAWIGGDADEFNADILRKLMPKFAELALAFTGIQVNLTKSSDTASSGDKKASGLASGFADVCSKIF